MLDVGEKEDGMVASLAVKKPRVGSGTDLPNHYLPALSKNNITH